MKSAVMVALNSMRRNKRSCLVTLFVIFASVAFVTMHFVFWIALIDFQENLLYKKAVGSKLDYQDEINQQTLTENIKSDKSYISVYTISMLFIVAGTAVGTLSSGNALMINGNEKAKTLSSLTMLGAKKHDRVCYLMADAVIMSVVAIPLGMLSGFCFSAPLLSHLNDTVCIPLGLPRIVALQNSFVKYCVVILITVASSVLIASAIPALRLIKKPLVELAKAKDNINISLKETWLDRKMVYHFGAVGQLASASHQNNKGKYRALSLSVSMSCSLFVILALFRSYVLANGTTSVSEMITEQFFKYFNLFVAIAFVLSISGACGLLYVRFLKRKPEFALLLSLGATRSQLRQTTLLEVLYYGINILLYVFLLVFIGDIIIFGVISTWTRNPSFIFPTAGIPTVVIVVMALLAAMSVLMLTVVSRVNVIDELKKNV